MTVDSSSDDPKLVRVNYDLSHEQKDGWPPSSVETFWAKVLSPSLFQVDNIPLYIRGLAIDDIIEAHLTDEGGYWYARTVEHCGHSTYRLFELESTLFRKSLDSLLALGCSFEGNAAKLYAVDVPPATDFVLVGKIIQQNCDLGIWDYEEGFLFNPNWP